MASTFEPNAEATLQSPADDRARAHRTYRDRRTLSGHGTKCRRPAKPLSPRKRRI